MRDFPESTFVNKVFSESKFFKKLALSKSKLPFGNIAKIVWRNKLSPISANLSEGNNVKEIQVFEVKLKEDKSPEKILQVIDNNILYHILFLIEFDGKYQAWIAYKEIGANGVSRTAKTYYKSDWHSFDDLPLEVQGLNLDEVYENFIAQLNLDIQADGEVDLREKIDVSAKLDKIRRDISKLEAKMLKEKQFNKQVDLKNKIENLRIQTKELK